MRTSDIYYLNLVREFLGINATEAGYYLGSNWKKWSKFNVNRLRSILQKRIDRLRSDGKQFQSIQHLAQILQDMDRRIAVMPDYEINLIKRYRTLTVDQIKEISEENETTPSNIIKAMKASGWKLGKQGRKHLWRASMHK
jgi:hypothetical protein